MWAMTTPKHKNKKFKGIFSWWSSKTTETKWGGTKRNTQESKRRINIEMTSESKFFFVCVKKKDQIKKRKFLFTIWKKVSSKGFTDTQAKDDNYILKTWKGK